MTKEAKGSQCYCGTVGEGTVTTGNLRSRETGLCVSQSIDSEALARGT